MDLSDPIDHDLDAGVEPEEISPEALQAARRLEYKALTCLAISMNLFPEDSENQSEEKASNLMLIQNDILERIMSRFRIDEPIMKAGNLQREPEIKKSAGMI